MEDVGRELGIVGQTLSDDVGLFRATTFNAFQKRFGWLERAQIGQFYGGHAACHALMNSMVAVEYFGVSRLEDQPSLIDAVSAVMACPNVCAVVVPGLTDPTLVQPVTEAFLAANASPENRTMLWLDPQRDMGVEEILTRQRSVNDPTGCVGVVTPWIRSISPGRRAAEPLPPTCFVGPLFAGVSNTLKGVHEVTSVPNETQKEKLRQAGCGLLTQRGRRKLLSLEFPAPQSDVVVPPPKTLEERINETLNDACREPIASGQRGSGLCKTVERQVRAALYRFKSSGEITDFRLLCEQDPDHPDALDLQVWISVPKRVKEVIIRTRID